MQKNKVDIIYKDVKHINLKVKPSGKVILTAPIDISTKEIDYILKKRTDWINQHLALFAKKRTVKRELVSGENFVYIGKNYRLKIIESNTEKAKLNHSYLELYVKNKNNYEKKEKLIQQWYTEKAKKCFLTIIKKYAPIVKADIKKIRIRSMKTRWGSCNPKKSYINLNLELIKKPKFAIEYVIFHELTHLHHHNHDARFYNYLTLHMPDWKKRKSILNN